MAAPPVVVTRTIDDLKDIRASKRKAPSRHELRKMFPGCEREEINPRTGRKGWVFDVVTHDGNGNQTAAGRELAGAFRDYARAEGERGAKLRSRLPAGVPLKDADGQRRFVAPHIAEEAAKRNGWRSGTRWKGRTTMMTYRGILWRLGATECEPMTEPAQAGVYRDPYGNAWRFVARTWRAIA